MKTLRLLLTLGIALAGSFVAVDSMLESFRLVPGVPYLDHLYLQAWFFHEVDRGREGLFPFELMRGNEHLVLFPMPLFGLDNALCSASGMLLVGFVQLANLAAAACIAGVARRTFGLGWLDTAAVGAATAGAWLWSMHGKNLFWPYQAHLYVWFLAWIAGAVATAHADRTRRPLALAASLAWATVGLFSFGFGIATFAALMAFALWRWSWRWSAIVSLVGSAELVVYWFVMAHPPRAVGDLGLLAQLANGVEHVLYLLSFPIWQLTVTVLPAAVANTSALVVTTTCLAMGGWAVVAWWRRPAEHDAARSVAAILVATGLLGAITTAISRPQLTDQAARADRYGALAVGLWVGLLLLGARHVRRLPALVTAVGALLMAWLVAAHLEPEFRHIVRIHRDALVAAEMATLNDVADPVALAILHPEFARPELWPRVSRGMRERQWGVFAGPQDEWIGQQLGAVFPRRGPPIQGFVHTQAPFAGGAPGARVDGHARDEASGEVPVWVVLVDTADKIVGIGHRHLRQAAELLGALPRDLAPELAHDAFWVGHVQAADPNLRVFAVRDAMTVSALQR